VLAHLMKFLKKNIRRSSKKTKNLAC